MKAIILHQQVHSLLRNDDPSLQINRGNWTPVPDAILDVVFPSITYEGLPYDVERQWFSATHMLARAKERKQQEFAATFTHLETRAARSTSSLTLRLAEGATIIPEADFDAGLLWSIEQVKQANRDLLAGLEALTIPDGATVEDAQGILAQALAIVPCLPESYGGGA